MWTSMWNTRASGLRWFHPPRLRGVRKTWGVEPMMGVESSLTVAPVWEHK